jgi:hypothetical protein
MLGIWLLPAMAWANGKICPEGAGCHTLFRVCQGLLACGFAILLIALFTQKKWPLRVGLFLGVVNTVVGGRFLSNPYWDLFSNHSTLWLVQLGLGLLLFAFSGLQILRERRERHQASS